MVKKIFILILLFIIIFSNICYGYSVSEVITKKFPINRHDWDNKEYVVIAYNRLDKTYYRYTFEGNKYAGNYAWYFPDTNSIRLYGFTYSYSLRLNYDNSLFWILFADVPTRWGYVELENIVDYFSINNKSNNGIEVIYSNLDIYYYGTDKIYFYKTPDFGSIVFQHGLGGCMYQTFRILLIPLFLFIISLISFYKSVDFIRDILIKF